MPNPKRVEHNPPFLYNLDEDPSERFDISEKFPEVIVEIKELVRKHNSKMVKQPDMLVLRVSYFINFPGEFYIIQLLLHNSQHLSYLNHE